MKNGNHLSFERSALIEDFYHAYAKVTALKEDPHALFCEDFKEALFDQYDLIMQHMFNRFDHRVIIYREIIARAIESEKQTLGTYIVNKLESVADVKPLDETSLEELNFSLEAINAKASNDDLRTVTNRIHETINRYMLYLVKNFDLK